jgi:hypothetical protein
MGNRANENRGSARGLAPEVELKTLGDLLNTPEQPDRRNAFRALVKSWLDAGSLKQMVANDPGLWLDVSEAWKPYFTFSGTGAVWSVNPIPSQTKLPSTPEGWAIRHLALLMLNPLRDNLRGPCPRPGCQRYYIKKRKTKVYCSLRCGNAANATRSNAALDKAKREALLKSAAKFWPQWTERKHPIRSFWIADRVNRSEVRIRTKKGWKPVGPITGKFVSRNAEEIEKRV